MSLVPVIPDYTDKDFDSIRLRLQSLISSAFPTWSDFNVANFGNLLLELNAHVSDILTFYQDNQAADSRWSTARQRRNLLAMVKLINFVPETAKAAQVDVTISVKDAASGGPPIGNVLVPAGTTVSTAQVSSPVKFQLLSDAIIAAGAALASDIVTAENSVTQTDVFVSGGTANQEFILTNTPFIDGSSEVTANNGAYSEVDNFLSSTALDRHYTVTVDQNDRARVRFGNGAAGAVPVGAITNVYKTGGGVAGQVEEGKVSVISGVFADSLGNPVVVSCTNVSRSSGAQDRQSVAQIKEAAPQSLRVLERSVAREDFEIEAVAVAGVSRALMLTSDEDVAIPENAGFLWVIPEGGGAPSTDLKNTVAAIFAENGPKPALLTFKVFVRDPIYRALNVRAKVFLHEAAERDPTKPNYAGTLIRSDLATFFALSNADGTKNQAIDFGFSFKDGDGNPANEIPLSHLINLVSNSASVRKLSPLAPDFLVNGAHLDIRLIPREFPQLGAVELIDGDTGAPL